MNSYEHLIDQLQKEGSINEKWKILQSASFEDLNKLMAELSKHTFGAGLKADIKQLTVDARIAKNSNSLWDDLTKKDIDLIKERLNTEAIRKTTAIENEINNLKIVKQRHSSEF